MVELRFEGAHDYEKVMCLTCILERHRVEERVEKIKIGKIVNAVALRGEVKVYHYSDYKERFEELDEILVERNAAKKRAVESYAIERVRYQKDMVILKLKGVDDRNAAEALKEAYRLHMQAYNERFRPLSDLIFARLGKSDLSAELRIRAVADDFARGFLRCAWSANIPDAPVVSA